MKRVILIPVILTLSLAAWAASPATPRTNAIHPGLFELGLNIGEPAGLSAKLWLDRNSALEGIAAWAFSQGAFAVSADYLVTFPDILKIETASFPLFVGIGGIARFSAGAGSAGSLTLALRVPLGVLFVFAKVPLEISLDIVPGLNLFPDTLFLAMGGLAVRYCF